MVKKFIQKLFIRVLIFGVAMVGVAFVFNAVSPNGVSLITEKRQIIIGEEEYDIPLFQSRNAGSGKRETVYTITKIDLKTARQKFQETGPLFIDARSREEYRAGHIPGAINIPVEELESFEIDLINLDPSQPFVCYCSDSECDLALEAGLWLQDHGFSNIYYFPEGWNVWVEEGNPVSKGAKL